MLTVLPADDETSRYLDHVAVSPEMFRAINSFSRNQTCGGN